MAAQYSIVLILLGFLGLPPDAKSADVVIATTRDEHVVEVAQADWAVVLEFVALLLGLVGVLYRIGIDELYIAFLEVSIDSD